jgi:hypothetical protein
MTTIDSKRSARPTSARLSLTVPAAVAAVVLTGCGGGTSTGQRPVVTVTVTPTVTAGAVPAPAKAPTAIATTAAPKSDVVGRKFDLGTIVKVEQSGGVKVIIFDRWTAPGFADSKVAAKGLPMGVHSDVRFENQNSKTTFRIPVVAGAIFTYNHCVAVDQPAQQRSSTLQEFATLPDTEKVILLTLDPSGQVFKAQNDPAC